jgi:signal transduction histidine kinase
MHEARAGAHVAGTGHPLDPPHDVAPWLPQTAFSGLLVLDVLLRWLGGSPVALVSWPALAVVVAVPASLASVAVPWRRLPAGLVCVLPVVDLGVVGLARLDAQVGGAGVLAVIPALWLGAVLGRRGAVVALVASLVLMVVPGFLYLGTSMPVVTRSLLIPVVAVASATAIAVALEQARSGLAQARHKHVQLAQALATIEDQRRFSDAILDTVDVGLVLLDADGTYRAMNRRHRAFMARGYPDGHAGRAGQLGHVYATADGTTPLVREEMPTYRASQGEEFDDQLLWIGQDPLTNRAVSVSARAVRDEDGTFTGAALAYKDVTDFVRALGVKDEFVASVSHELRTPLTSIVGYVLLLQEREDLAPDVLKQLGVVARNTDRLQRLVSDLLQTAQVDEGPLQVVRTPHDLVQIVRDAALAATPTAETAGIRLVLDVPDRLDLLVDAQRMAQVVDNLLSNAIKYSPGGGEVGVRLHVDGNRAELAVSDTGIGIEAADRDRLFTRFFRARHAEEQSIQGVGLGLSITKAIVEGHGGRIVVDSEIGRGSTFRVRLPLD